MKGRKEGQLCMLHVKKAPMRGGCGVQLVWCKHGVVCKHGVACKLCVMCKHVVDMLQCKHIVVLWRSVVSNRRVVRKGGVVCKRV